MPFGAKPFAAHLRPQLAELCAALEEELRLVHPEASPDFLPEWIALSIDLLEGAQDQLGQAAFALVEGLRPQGDSETALRLMVRLRKELIRRLRQGFPELDADEIYEPVLESVQRQAVLINGLLAQHAQDAAAEERRLRRSIADALDRPFLLLDEEGRIVLANQHFAAWAGTAPDKLTGAEFTRFCDAAAAAQLLRLLKARRPPAPQQFSAVIQFGNKSASAMLSARLLGSHSGGAALALAFTFREEKAPGATADAHALLQALGRRWGICCQLLRENTGIMLSTGRRGQLPAEWAATQEKLCCRIHVWSEAEGSCICVPAREQCEERQVERSVVDKGVRRWFQVLVAPLAKLGAGDAYACFVRETTAAKQLEMQVLRQQRVSPASQVAAAVAQQLRNPLSVMLGYAELLREGMESAEREQALERMLRNGLRCREIVDDLLDGQEAAPSQNERVDVAELARNTVQPMLTDRQRERIAWEVPARCGEVEAPSEQLAQVLLNLLDNALHFARDRVTFALTGCADRVVVRVEDDGPGVSETIRERMFEPFFSTRRDEGAVGLGLSLSQAVLDTIGGCMRYEDRPSGGAVFQVVLPKAPAPPAPAQASKRKRVLLVDDELDLAEMLSTALRREGYEVTLAATAQSAREALDRQAFDAAVLDVHLPGEESGRHFFAFLQQAHPSLARRTVLITADTVSYDTRRFLEATEQPGLEKPFLVADLLDQLERLFENKPRGTKQ